MVRETENQAEKDGKDPAEAVKELATLEEIFAKPDDGATLAELQEEYD